MNEEDWIVVSVKRCRKCKIVKDAKDFHRHKEHADGLQSFCKRCQNQYKNEYRKRTGIR